MRGILRGNALSTASSKCFPFRFSQGWIDCWSVPIVALSIQYTYHPMPPLGPDPQADITTPEKEEILLSPMRIPISKLKSPAMKWNQMVGCLLAS